MEWDGGFALSILRTPNADTMPAAKILGSGVNNGVKNHFTLATVSER